MRNKVVLALAATSALAGPALADLTPNSQRYAERNPSAATGRSGNATLSVRTLLGKDGQTVVDVASGRVDSTAPTGNITKLQFKAFDNREEVAWTQNYSSLTGSTHQKTFGGFRRGQPLQTQANIKSIDGKRTDVVVTTGNVKVRPDLAVSNVAAPATEKTGVAVVISAIVSEVNGDLGATANCVLSVDGVEADRANGIWVDASGTVSCAFTKVFDEVGTYNLSVSATDVDPGDWDTANNTATAAIEIVSPVVNAPFTWYANAWNYSGHNTGRRYGWYDEQYYYGGYHSDWDYGWDHRYRHEAFHVDGYSPTLATFPLTISLAASADGQSFVDDTRTIEPDYAYTSGEFSQAHYNRYDASTGHYQYVDTYGYTNGWANTHVQTRRFGGDVVYQSWGYQQYWSSYYGSYYFYSHNSTQVYSEGYYWPMTQSASFQFAMTDAASTTWTASGELALQPFQYEYTQPWYCYQWNDWYWYGRYGYSCYEDRQSQQGYSGSLSGSN